MGLAQRAIEEAGFTTITISNIPDLTSAVGVPRLAAVEHPFGRTMGDPGDAERQRGVLRGALEAVAGMTVAGSVRHLPYEWAGTAREAARGPSEPPPIVGYLKRRPWLLPRLISRKVPPAD